MELIFDRTQEDVNRRTFKGNYGWEDLNRVEKTVKTLCREMEKLDIFLPLRTKTDWTLPGNDWPVPEQMQRYLENVRQILQTLDLPLPLPDTMAYLDYQGANQIEYALHTAQKQVQAVCKTFQFSGECIAGEENRI